MNQHITQPQKLHSHLNSLLNSKTRLESAQHKLHIKTILQQQASILQTTCVIQQLLAYSIESKRIKELLNWLQQNTEFVTLYAKSLQELIKKYIESGNQMSKLDQESGKFARILLTKKIMQDTTLLNNLIDLSRSDQHICSKLLKLITQYLKQHKPTIDVTSLITLCINLLRIKQHISTSILKNCIMILNYMLTQSQQLQTNIYPLIMQQILDIFKSQKAEKESLQLLTNYIKYNTKVQKQNNCPTVTILNQYIHTILKHLQNKTKQKYQIKSQKQNNIQQQYSIQIIKFIEICNNFITYTYTQYEHNNDRIGNNNLRNNLPNNLLNNLPNNLRNNLQNNNQYNLQQQLIILCKDMLLVLWPGSIGRIYQILTEIKIGSIWYIQLSQIFINCIAYNFTQKQTNRKQKQLITYILIWYNTLSINQQKLIRQKLSLNCSLYINTSVQCQSQKDNFLSLFLQFLKKTIQTQFQYQFNKQSIISVCNVLCYFSQIFPTKYNQRQIKQQIMQIIKMLLNLNQSCQKQYRQILVKNILKIICVYCKELLSDNQFLREVVENQIWKNIFKFKNQVRFLGRNKMLSEGFYEKMGKIVQEQVLLLDAEIGQIQFIFDMLISHDKQIMDTIFTVNTGNTYWQWYAYVHSSARKIYSKQWNIPQKQLKNIKDNKMLQYNIQFDQDINKIQQLCGIKK